MKNLIRADSRSYSPSNRLDFSLLICASVVANNCLAHRLAALFLRFRRVGAEFISLQRSIAVQKMFLLGFRDAELRAPNFGGFDQAFVLKNEFDARHRFDDRFAKNQLFYGCELVLKGSRFVEFT